eukprot:6180140-Pleurochrysis_carterae.AAC.1
MALSLQVPYDIPIKELQGLKKLHEQKNVKPTQYANFSPKVRIFSADYRRPRTPQIKSAAQETMKIESAVQAHPPTMDIFRQPTITMGFSPPTSPKT